MKTNIKLSECISDGALGHEVVLDSKEILALSNSLSHIYIEIIENLTIKFSQKYQIPSNSIRIILRSAIVPITHCFFARLIRLNKIINSSSIKPSIAEYDFFSNHTINTMPDFLRETQHSVQFNQGVISLLSEVWNLEKIVVNNISELNIQEPKNFENHLFALSKSKFNLTNILKLIDRYTQWLPPLGRFPVLGFSNSSNALHKRFFYLRNFKRVNFEWPQVDQSIDFDAREDLFNTTNLESNKVDGLLSSYGFSNEQKNVITSLYSKFLKLSFPIESLEGLQNNYKEAKKALLPFKVKALLFSDSGLMHPLFVISAAKSMGFKIINAQHGGHYGYRLDYPPFTELEYPFNDEFLTWGWQTLPKHPAFKTMKTRPLPDPWLSERKSYWQDLVIEGPKEFDILWMPHLIRPFAEAPEGSGSNRIGVVNEFSKSMVDFTTEAVKAKIKVLCKPFNPRTFYLMSDTFKTIEDIGGEFLECTDQFDKGMSYDLLSNCRLVLWDLPGTGFLECLVSGIPTMILWAPYYKEEPWCVDDFKNLEEAGVIHRTPQSLLEENRVFLNNPFAWMNNTKRQVAIQKFSNKYALSDDKWWKSWRDYLKEQKNDNKLQHQY